MRRVQRVNGHGMLRDDDDGIAHVGHRLSKRWRCGEDIQHRDRHGQAKLKENFSRIKESLGRKQLLVDFVRDDYVAAPRDAFGGEMGFDDDERSDLRKCKAAIVRHLLDFDGAEGLSERHAMPPTNSTPRRRCAGQLWRRLQRDSQGLAHANLVS